LLAFNIILQNGSQYPYIFVFGCDFEGFLVLVKKSESTNIQQEQGI